MLKEYNIAVVGLGLIGGSILKALRPKRIRLTAVSRSQETLIKAVDLDLADEYSSDLSLVKSAEIVFICTPISKIIPTIEKVRQIVDPDCIITDVASLKGFIMDYVNDYNFPTNFIGGHPMAGTENKGIDNSVDNLFEGAKWILTPSKWSDPGDILKLEEIIHYLGAETILADPYNHDKAVALISHMPLLLSQALFGMINDFPDKNIRELALKLAASGFRDTTRLASTNPELAKDMLFMNKLNVREAIEDFVNYTTLISEDLDLDEEKFSNFVEIISAKRKIMYSPEGKNIYKAD